jgi:hypothetical protein
MTNHCSGTVIETPITLLYSHFECADCGIQGRDLITWSSLYYKSFCFGNMGQPRSFDSIASDEIHIAYPKVDEVLNGGQ